MTEQHQYGTAKLVYVPPRVAMLADVSLETERPNKSTLAIEIGSYCGPGS